MPKVTWGRDVSEAVDREEWLRDIDDAIESKRRKNRPSYQVIADSIGISRQSLHYKIKEGSFTLEEFRKLSRYLRFSDEVILKLVK